MTALTAWQNFYLVVGSSAGALIGLQFVVIALIADTPLGRNEEQAGQAFATPTVVHFGAVLLLSASSSTCHGMESAMPGLSGDYSACLESYTWSL